MTEQPERRIVLAKIMFILRDEDPEIAEITDAQINQVIVDLLEDEYMGLAEYNSTVVVMEQIRR